MILTKIVLLQLVNGEFIMLKINQDWDLSGYVIRANNFK